MGSLLFTLYGPFAVHSYGLFIVIGMLVFMFFIKRDPQYKRLNLEPNFYNFVSAGIVIALIGGRALYLLTHVSDIHSFTEIFAYWQGGFSVLGSMLAMIVCMPLYIKWFNVPIIPLLDLIVIYIPLLHAISRIGCFFAGCCYGLATNVPWAVIYNDPHCMAPLNYQLHPTQLYSVIAQFLIFVFLYTISSRISHKINGQLTCLYLLLSSLERLGNDFWRGDRTIVNIPLVHNIFSLNQLIALGIAFIALTFLVVISLRRQLQVLRPYESI